MEIVSQEVWLPDIVDIIVEFIEERHLSMCLSKYYYLKYRPLVLENLTKLDDLIVANEYTLVNYDKFMSKEEKPLMTVHTLLSMRKGIPKTLVRELAECHSKTIIEYLKKKGEDLTVFYQEYAIDASIETLKKYPSPECWKASAVMKIRDCTSEEDTNERIVDENKRMVDICKTFLENCEILTYLCGCTYFRHNAVNKIRKFVSEGLLYLCNKKIKRFVEMLVTITV